MPRAKGVPRSRRRKRILRRAKGFVGGRGRLHRTAKEAIMRADVFAYRDRRAKKRDFRRLWITRISAAAKERGISYSVFMHGLSKASAPFNRKMLADIALNDPEAFSSLVELAAKEVKDGS
ncbi:50S ribosomal protein L20 [Planctomycetota bacterium]